MPSRTTVANRRFRHWQAPYWRGPTTTPPNIDGPLYQSWDNSLLISGGNNGYEVRNGLLNGLTDRGGNFLVHKRSYEDHLIKGSDDVHFSWSEDPSYEDSPYTLTNQWPWRDEFNSSHFPLPTASTDDQLAALGTTAIARCAPTKPKADLSTFLGELREGLPHAVGLAQTGKERARQARNAGDEYLNIEFGWKPLLRDVYAFANAYKKSKDYLDKYHKGAGVLIKRKYRFPTELKEETEMMGYRRPLPLLHPANYGYWGTSSELQCHKLEKIEQWFSATFIYDVPRMEDPYRHYNDVDYLLGVKLTPEVLWNLAPWSWAADWVANTGDIMSNLSSFATDGLVMPYAYMMEHKTNVYTYSMVCDAYWWSHPETHNLRQVFTAETKKRIQATPYGFGLNWDEFSTRQLAILGSLGISRAK